MGHKILVLLFFFLAVFSMKGQETSVLAEDETVYEDVDLRAGYPGGLDVFFHYIVINMKFRGGQEAEATLEFIVEKDGSVSNVTVKEGKKKWFNNDMIRVVSQSPRWLPAYKAGNPVRMRFSLPLKMSDNWIRLQLKRKSKSTF